MIMAVVIMVLYKFIIVIIIIIIIISHISGVKCKFPVFLYN